MTPDQQIFLADRTFQMREVFDLVGVGYRGVPSQVSCPVHKSGGETRPSARLFEDGLWCYTCGKQYRPTEVLAAFKSFSRQDAAVLLLSKRSPDRQTQDQLLREYHKPRQPPVPEILLSRANDALLRYRHKVPLDIYREWAKRLIQLKQILMETELDLQQGKLQAFIHQLNEELNNVDV